ncbi:YeeE/YedE family protein [Georgenia halophila]|uniref:YeeE/YedE family protein n=1 Tax=Georgenia halophila TaxID=620889 RepID=A0ABP8L6C6_9MICO
MLLTGLLLGAVLGFVMQRSRFCVTGAFRDVFVSRSTRWLTAFLIVIAIQSVGVAALQGAGVISPPSDALALPAVVAGGLIFGVAIVLAGGCATGTYYRSGEGLIGSWIALALYGISAAAMKYGVLAGFTTWATSFTVPVTTIHASLGVSSWVMVAALGAVVLYLVRRHLATPRLPLATLPSRRTGAARVLFEKPWGAFSAAVLVGLIAIVAWPLSTATGRESGLGITTPSADIVTYLVTGDPEVVDWGVFLVLGLLVGSFVAAKGSGEFRLRVPDGTTVVRSVIGGTGMGVGAALAGGCTIGAAMVDTAQFSYQGWLAFGCMVLGVGLGTRAFVLRRPLTAGRSTTPVGAAA